MLRALTSCATYSLSWKLQCRVRVSYALFTSIPGPQQYAQRLLYARVRLARLMHILSVELSLTLTYLAAVSEPLLVPVRSKPCEASRYR